MKRPKPVIVTKVDAILCFSCLDTVYSRARHDFRSCSCGNVSIDGGFDYTKISWRPGSLFEQFNVEVIASKQQLWNDWSTGADIYGVIPNSKGT